MFYDRFTESVHRFPDLIAVELQRESSAVAAGAPPVESYTFTQLRDMAESVGNWLLQSNITKGSKCAFLAANHPCWVAAYLGVLASGNTAVPLDTAFHPDQVHKLLLDSDAVLLFCDRQRLVAAKEAARGLPIKLVLIDGRGPLDGLPSLADIFAAGPAGFHPVPVTADDIAMILYTSGTTSDPKGVMLSHGNLDAEAQGVFEVIDLGPTDAILGILPLFHSLAQMANIMLPLSAGMRVVYLESLNTTDLLKGLQERDITFFACVPQFFYLIHERIHKEVQQKGALVRSLFRAMMAVSAFARRFHVNLGKLFFGRVHHMLGPRMRYLVTGGSRFDPAVGRQFEAMGFTMLQGYGMTETCGAASVTPPRENVMGSIGKPLPGNEMKIFDGRPSPEHGNASVGEIAFRGGIIMAGYYKRPDATAAMYRDGWLCSGDLGYCDAAGNFFITGRKKDLIVLSNGKNIYPEEIEAHYQQSPNIKEVCVLGLQSAPGEPFSERLHGVIVPDFEALRRAKIVNVGDMLRFEIEGLSARVPSTKRILSYEIWQNDLPRTSTRKIKRFEVEQRVKRGEGTQATANAPRQLTPEESEWMQQPAVSQALGIIQAASKLKKDTPHPADNLELDLGLDSMERVELVVSLDQQMGANVPDSVASEIYTVRDLVDAVLAHTGAENQRAAAGWDEVIREEPGEIERRTIDHAHPILAPFVFILLQLAQLMLRDLFRLKIEGVEKLPPSGPFILSPNHQSYIDAPVVVACLPWRTMRDAFYVGTSEIFGSKLMRRIAESFRLIVIDPDANLVPAMRAGAYGLRNNGVLVLFPEGERSIDGPPKLFKKGAAILAIHTQCPVVPVALEGFFEAWPRGEKFRGLSKLKVRFLDPVYPPPLGPNPESQYASMTAEIRSRILAAYDDLRARR
ncbi:MAG TPA: AMP-binding protein [Candidatus Bathyarchaeia archaeon]|nr:AMP-binding protein [Candidatus Bathyarchaeia archaeon]